jgi:hypothetical protein
MNWFLRSALTLSYILCYLAAAVNLLIFCEKGFGVWEPFTVAIGAFTLGSISNGLLYICDKLH